ncbi:hypothetical protein D3C71_720960 [compost metagenome]
MKFILIFSFLGTTFFSSGQDLDVAELFSPVDLKGDSGYFQQVEVYRILGFLAKNIQCDELQERQDSIIYDDNESDTLGKFIYLQEQNRYFVCLNLDGYNDNWQAHCILELERKDDRIILRNHRFLAQGNYACCWENNFDGFIKWNRFAVYKVCGTGMSMCSSNWMVFNNLSENVPLEFVHDYWIGGEVDYKSLNSKTEWIGDTLTITYTLEKGIIKDQGKKLAFKKRSTEIVIVKGILKDGVFVFDRDLPDLNSPD